MRILITGATGFIGSQCWEYFLRRGHEVVGLDVCLTPVTEGRKFFHSDLRQIGRQDIADVDAIIHCAGRPGTVRSFNDPTSDLMGNAVSGFVLAHWAREHCSGPLIYANTSKVYGTDHIVPVNRYEPWDPQTPHGISKATAGRYFRFYLPKQAYILNQGSVYGTDQQGTEAHGWVSWIARHAAEENKIKCFGEGNQVRDVLYIRDLFDLYEKIVLGFFKPPSKNVRKKDDFVPVIPSGTYVVGGGDRRAWTFKGVCELFGVEIGEKLEVQLHDQRYFVADNSGLDDWKPTTCLEAVKDSMVDAWRERIEEANRKVKIE